MSLVVRNMRPRAVYIWIVSTQVEPHPPTLIAFPEKGICRLCQVSPWIQSRTTSWTCKQIGMQKFANWIIRILAKVFCSGLSSDFYWNKQLTGSKTFQKDKLLILTSLGQTFSSEGSTSLKAVMLVPPYLKSSSSTICKSWGTKRE